MKSKVEQIICDDSQNITKWHNEKNITLSIIKPPYITCEDLNEEYLTKLQIIIKQIAKVTKNGGICCLILDEEKNSNQTMSSVSKNIFQMMESKNLEDWEKHEEIIWVKSPKSSTESINPMESGILINYEDTPFSTIHIFQRKGSEFEYVDSEERISKIDIDGEVKTEWNDSVWFVQPKKKSEFQDRIPYEIIARLIQIFTYEKDIILDPFAGQGIVCKVATELNRKYICFEKDEKNYKIAHKRISQI